MARWQDSFRSTFSGLLKFILPASCAACHTAGTPFCENCYQKLEWIEPPVCEHCGHSISREAALCASCRQALSTTCSIRAVVRFAGPIRPAIHALKYGKQRGVAESLATIMIRGWKEWGSSVDIVLPIPLHVERYRMRGFNQSAEIAKPFAAAFQLPLNTNVIYRKTQTRPQVGLRKQARLENVRDAFYANSADVAGKKILLIDDVCTTGATLSAAADVLYQAGAVSVSAYALARAQDYREHAYPEMEMSF